MKRSTSSVPSRIWKYGLPKGPEPECAAAVEEQFRAGRHYSNQLIEIELKRRADYRAARTRLVPGIAEAELALESANTAVEQAVQLVNQHRSRGRTRSNDQAALSALKIAKADRKDLASKLKALRLAAQQGSAELEAASEQINAAATAAIKQARASTTVYWGTGGLADKAAEAQRKSKTDPVFRRWDGSGRIGVHLQPTISVTDLMNGSSRIIQIEHLNDPKHPKRCVLSLRIGSTVQPGKRPDPVWAKFKMVLHRPLPPDALINDAWVQRYRVGTRWRWELCISMRAQSFVAPARTVQQLCAIDVGWRKLDDGSLRCGVLVGTDGALEQLVVPTVIMSKLKYADSLRSIRDKNFEAVKFSLLNAANRPTWPAWLTEATMHLGQWRSTERLMAVVNKWRDQRFAGDEEIFALADGWRKQDRHLWQWEASQRDKTLGRRKEHYRTVAAKIAERYACIVIEDLDLRDFAELDEPGDPSSGQEKPQRLARTRAALSEFLEALTLAASNRGSSIMRVPAEYTTSTCHVCREQCDFDRMNLTHTCEHCGVSWDQDVNAARNLLAFPQAQAAE